MKQVRIPIFLFLSSLSWAAGSYYEVVGVADNDTLSVRQSASASSKKVGELMAYDTGIIINNCKKNGSTTWCKINFLPDDIMFFERGVDFSKDAWVNKKYLKQASNIIYPNALLTFRVINVASNDTLNVRQHPRNTAKKIGQLKYDDFGIVAMKCQRVKASSWCYVGYDYVMAWAMGPGSTKVPYAQLGWVNMRYLKRDDKTKNSRLPGMTFPGEGF